jgi:hypothetical protein
MYNIKLSGVIIVIRPYIREQLKKCNFADLANYDEKSQTFFIPKYCKPTYDLNKCYLIEVADYFIGNKTNLIAVNWNNGSAPVNKYLKIYVSKMLGKMIYVDTLAYDIITNQDINNYWSGWLSVDDIKQLARI